MDDTDFDSGLALKLAPHICAVLADAQQAQRVSDCCLLHQKRYCPLYRDTALSAALPDASLADRIWTLYRLAYAGAFEIIRETEDGWFLFPTTRILPEKEYAGRVCHKDARSGFVYLLEGSGFYKIGKSIDVNRRLTEIIMPFEIRVVHFLAYDDMAQGERAWHQHFADKRGKGEWFELTPDDVAEFCSSQRPLSALATKLLRRLEKLNLRTAHPTEVWGATAAARYAWFEDIE